MSTLPPQVPFEMAVKTDKRECVSEHDEESAPESRKTRLLNEAGGAFREEPTWALSSVQQVRRTA